MLANLKMLEEDYCTLFSFHCHVYRDS